MNKDKDHPIRYNSGDSIFDHKYLRDFDAKIEKALIVVEETYSESNYTKNTKNQSHYQVPLTFHISIKDMDENPHSILYPNATDFTQISDS